MRRTNRLQERRKRIKKLILSSILYVSIIGGASAFGIGIVHFFFNPTTSTVTQANENQNVDNNEPIASLDESDNNSSEENNQDSDQSTQSTDEENNGEDTSTNNSEEDLGGPVGTTQEEPHQTSYDENSVDWEEMKTALSVAINVDKSNMSLWWIGNNGGSDRSFGIVSERGTDHYKRVAIEWVTNKGWKPTDIRDVTEEEYKQYIEKYVNN
jgi:cytoskeletal protein RodZ